MIGKTLLQSASASAVCKLPAFNLDQVRSFILKHYDIDASLKQLEGERDLNYLVDSKDGSSDQFVFKVCNEQESIELLGLQTRVMGRVAQSGQYKTIEAVSSNRGNLVEEIVSASGSTHYCRLTTFLSGELLSAVLPRSAALLESLGKAVAGFGLSVKGLPPEPLQRPLLWHMENGVEVLDHFSELVVESDHKSLLDRVRTLFIETVIPINDRLPRSIIHNDANDNNIVVANHGPWEQSVKGLIDFGDMVYCWRISDLAIACAYAMLGQDRPLDVAVSILRGYQRTDSLSEAEVSVLFPMIMMRLAMSVSICARQKMIEPDNQYLVVSEKPAWQMLQNLSKLSPQYVHFLFRDACDLPPVPGSNRIASWLGSQERFYPVCDMPSSVDQMLLLDNSVSSPHLEVTTDYDVERMSRGLNRALEDAGATTGIGRYDEYRLIYQSEDFLDASGHQRTLHLGIDVFQSAESKVYCPLDAVIYSVADNDAPFDYGGTVILQHDIVEKDNNGFTFYTLYGHLSPASFSQLKVGAPIQSGALIGHMGEPKENGNWPPHVHFEIITDMLGEEGTFVGVGSHGHRNVWLSLCLDPNLILRLPEEFLNQPLSDASRTPEDINHRRKQFIPKTLSLSYQKPLSIARGAGQYLYDFSGRQYLDAVNNVPHVGHCHPMVLSALSESAGVLNTNTRYLYRGLGEYAERLLEKCPKPLSKVFLVNSGSEANDLALRMAFSHTERSDVLTLEHGYHGNLSSLIDISGYKHDGPGGKGAPAWVHKAPVPDLYRSALPVDASGEEHAEPLKALLEKGNLRGNVAAFISETIPGCGGQLILPDGYLNAVYEIVRQAGGVCIADEVQTGFGRVGTHFWAFETQGVVPDILTLGKPAGNGHPLGAVITTDEIADSFTNGMEYFNTFGGNPVSCAAGCAVLDVIELEELQSNARVSGAYLMKQLDKLSEQHAIVGDVRGCGLFIGVELVESRETLVPAPHQASYIAERMKQEGVLISTDGPWHNVLKIKPPIVFNKRDGDILCASLGKILTEGWSQPGAFDKST